MKFQVPQFIEVEDKIFGPLTLKQFIYLAGAGGVVFMLWRILPIFIAIIAATPIITLAIALAFYKVNKRPFVSILEAAFRYALSSRLYIWKHKNISKMKGRQEDDKKIEKTLIRVPKLSESKLKDIAWSLDIKESIYSDEKQRN